MEKLNIRVDLEIQPDPKFSGKGLTSIFLLNFVGPFFIGSYQLGNMFSFVWPLEQMVAHQQDKLLGHRELPTKY